MRLRDKASRLKHAPIPRLPRLLNFLVHLFLFALLFVNRLAWGEIFGSGGGRWRLESEDHVVRHVETEARYRSIATIVKNKLVFLEIAKRVTVVVVYDYKKTGIVDWQRSQVCLRDSAESRNQNGVSLYNGTFPLLAHGTAFLVPSSEIKSGVRMGVCDARIFLTPSSPQGRHSSPSKFSWDMATILKVDNYFSFLFRVLRNNKISQDSVFSSESYISSLTDLQSILREFVSVNHLPKLHTVDDSYKDTDENGAKFKSYFPPWGLIGLAVLSLFLGFWGWLNLRTGRRIFWSFWGFCIGCSLWGYSVLNLFRWFYGI
jgi:hypothetical protein